MNIKKIVHLDSSGNPWGILNVFQLWANVYGIIYSRPDKRIDKTVWADLFDQAKTAAIEFGAETLTCRIRLEYEPDLFKEILTERGFKKDSGRIEYQLPISELPNEVGSPLTWRTAKELQWDALQIAAFTKRVVEGALDVDPDEKVENFIQDWLQHEEFTSGLDCIAIGFDGEEPCALAVAQINKDTGWSRITYMGLIPSHRGNGFGKWVHRHGFNMMKEQGGKLYHGGTLVQNHQMRRLFESHGCKVFCEMEEWSCKLN